MVPAASVVISSWSSQQVLSVPCRAPHSEWVTHWCLVMAVVAVRWGCPGKWGWTGIRQWLQWLQQPPQKQGSRDRKMGPRVRPCYGRPGSTASCPCIASSSGCSCQPSQAGCPSSSCSLTAHGRNPRLRSDHPMKHPSGWTFRWSPIGSGLCHS